MKRIKHNGREIILYSSVEELPVTRFQEFNRFMLIDSGIGGDLDAVDRHLSAVLRYNEQGEKDKLTKEVMNLRQNLAFAMSNITPEMGAFIALIHSIDGEKFDDFSEDGIRRVTEILSRAGASRGNILSWMKDIKKNLTKVLSSSFRSWRTAESSENTTRY